MLKRLVLLLLLVPAGLSALEADQRTVLRWMRFDEIVQVLRHEGIADSKTLPVDLLLGQGGDAWLETLDEIYDTKTMLQTVEAAFLDTLGSQDLSSIVQFVSSETWQEAVELELAGRKSMIDPDIEAAAYDNFYAKELVADARLLDLEELIEAIDLVEGNIAGAMNSMYQFNLGLAAGGLDIGYTEDEILNQIWAEEDLLRADVTEWIFAFLLMAYDPLESDALRAQITFFKTPEGQRLNRAMLNAFDTMYDGLSFQLGLAIATLAHEQML